MTQHHDDAFAPDTVDERVDQLASREPPTSSSPGTQVVQRLHALYEEDQRSTERVWERLAQHVSEHDESEIASEYQQPGSLSRTSEGKVFIQQGPPSFRRRGPTRLMLVAAVLFATLLVSSLLWTIHLTHGEPSSIPVKQLVPASPPGVYLVTYSTISRLDAQTSKVIWRTNIPAKVVPKMFAGRPIVIGNTVYLILRESSNTLLAFDANKGGFRWLRVFDRGIGDISLVHGLLYVYPWFLSNNKKLYVVDPVSGKTNVTIDKTPPGGWEAPIVNGVQYYVRGSKPGGTSLYALQLSGQKQLWHHQFPADQTMGYGDITVKNGIVYVSSMILATGNRKDSAGLLYAFDASTGKQLWMSPELPRGVRTFLVSDDSIVYCASFGDFDAFDAHTGKHLWNQHHNVTDMVLSTGVLYINDFAAPKGPEILALRARDGKKIWDLTSDAGQSAFPFLGLQRGIIYIIADNGKVGSIDAVRASDGARLWHLPITGSAIAFNATVA
jgi:outer membrane protein assembly factor BamB